LSEALVDAGDLNRATQTELARVGCLVGEADGKWGPASRKALQAFADRRGLKLANLDPTDQMLREIAAIQERVCDPVCKAGTKVQGGECVPITTQAFDGAWELTRRSGNQACDYTEQTTLIFIDGTDVSAIAPVAGTITVDGLLDIYLSFVDDDGSSGQNHITGKIRGSKGSGEFTRVGGQCAGVVSLRKRPE
jgi:hypothetical protein